MDHGEKSNEILKTIFKEQLPNVVSAVSSPTVWETLYSKSVITPEHLTELTPNAHKRDGGRRLLEILRDRFCPNAYVILLEALEEENKWIVEKINEEYEKKLQEPRRSVGAFHQQSLPVQQHRKVDRASLRDYDDVDDAEYNDVMGPRFAISVEPTRRSIRSPDAQTIDLSRMFQMFEQIMNVRTPQDSNAAPAADRRTSPTSAESVKINADEEHVYEALENVKENVSERIKSLQKRLDDNALRTKDAQYNVAMMSIQPQQPSAGPKIGQKGAYLSLADGNPIRAVTCLANTLIVIRDKDSGVEFYEAGTFQYKIAVNGLEDPRDMAACSHHQIIYVRDETQQTIHWISVGGDKRGGRWMVGERAAGISVNSRNQLLIVCPDTKRIRITMCDGGLIRCIYLTPAKSFTKVNDAVELCTDRIVVSCGAVNEPEGKVCIVDGLTGNILQQYVGRKNAKQAFVPLRLAVCGFIFVADYMNERVLRLRPDLDSGDVVKVIATGTCLPTRICVDDCGKNIYVVDNTRDSGGNCTKGCVLVVPLHGLVAGGW